MSRTIRSSNYHPLWLRRPRTTNELRQVKCILHDLQNEDYMISGMNHLHRRLNLPTYWDDKVCSSYYQR